MSPDRRHSAEKGSHANSMGSKDDTANPRREPARLYLVTPPLGDPATIADQLADALNTADIAAVLVRFADADERAIIERIKALRILVQSNGAALLLDGHAQLATRIEVDGAHLSGDAFKAGAAILKPKLIAGCGGLATRHDAMLAGESNADYVMFGEPDAQGARPGFSAVLERVEWWASVFVIPCVGYASSLDEAEALARAGADFVALGDFVWHDARATVTAAARLLDVMEGVP
jgi:thiamine-phosphate pyrophosphorylase